MKARRLCALVSLGLVACLLAAAPVSADAERPRGKGLIAFWRFNPELETGVLKTAHADGSHQRKVLKGFISFPEWSPDRRKLIFDFSDPAGNQQIAVVRRDGSGLRQLTDLPGISEAAGYSPDGETIVFDRSPLLPDQPGFFTSLWVMKADGDEPHPVFTPRPRKFDVEPEFSPSGEQISFSRLRVAPGGSYFKAAVFVVDADGTDERQLTPYRRWLEHPKWSPDGRNIVFNISHPELGHPADGVYLVRSNGTRMRRILASDLRLSGFKPDFSPGGKKILFGCYIAAQDQDDLCVMDANGSNVRNITRTPKLFENHPVWS